MQMTLYLHAFATLARVSCDSITTSMYLPNASLYRWLELVVLGIQWVRGSVV
jgi:hypothetical protein